MLLSQTLRNIPVAHGGALQEGGDGIHKSCNALLASVGVGVVAVGVGVCVGSGSLLLLLQCLVLLLLHLGQSTTGTLTVLAMVTTAVRGRRDRLSKKGAGFLSLGAVGKVLLDSSPRGSMTTGLEGRIDVEACSVVGRGGNVETTKDHRGQLTKVQTVLQMSGQCL